MPYQVDSQRQRRRFTLAGLAGLLSVGALIPMLNSAPATVAQDITPVVPACRTILQGDQTSLYLYDLRQFVPVEGLAETSVAADTPAPAGTPVTADALLATPVAEPTDEPDATPMAETTVEPVASVSASPMASPDASPIAETVTVSDEDQLRSVVFGVLNCTNLRDFDTLADLATNTYLRNTFAGGADLPRTDLLALADRVFIKNYRQAPIVLTRGHGAEVWDAAGRRYLDMTAGIAVCGLGHAHPAFTSRVAEQLGAMASVDYVVLTAGSFDILAEVVCENDDDLIDLLNRRIRSIPGVASTETFVYLRLHKQFYNWGTR